MMSLSHTSSEVLAQAIISNDFSTVMELLRSLPNANLWLTTDPFTNQFQGKCWRTPLMLACENNCLLTVKTILAAGGNPKIQNDSNQTAIHLACLNGHAKIASVLLESDFDINAKYKNLDPLLHLATVNGHLEVVKVLCNKGIDINITNHLNRSPLIMACIRGHIAVAEYLIDNGADVNFQDNDQEIALHKVIKITDKSSKWLLVKVLLKAGSNVNKGNHRNHTPLYCACDHISCPLDVIVLLLEYGADPLLRSYDDYLPLNKAVERNRTDVVRLLLNIGSDVNSVECYSYSSPLICAVKHQNEDIVKLLLSHKADVNFVSRQKTSAFIEACKYDNISIALEVLKHVKNVNVLDKLGNTSLHYACAKGHVKIVNLLLKKNSDVTILNNQGMSALHLACQNSCVKSIKLLLRSGAYVNDFQENSVFKASLEIKKASKSRNRRSFFFQTNIPYLLLDANFDLAQDKSLQPIETFLLSLDPQVLKDNQDFINDLMHLSQKPLSLKYLCCNVIRKILGQNLQKNVKFLPVPKHLQSLIAFHRFTI